MQAIAARQLAGAELRPSIDIDVQIPLEEVDWATHELLRLIEPCGMKNPQPVLLSRGVTVRNLRAIGSGKKHLKLALHDQRGRTWNAIAFRRGDLLGQVPARVDVVYKLQINEWNHKKTLQLLVQDIQAA